MGDVGQYDAAARRQIARRASRQVSREGTLILAAGFAFLMVFFFFFGTSTFLPLAEVFGVRPIVVWVVLSFGVSAVWAYLHVRVAGPRVAEAQRLDAEFKYEQQARVQAENAKKAAMMEKDKAR